MNLATLALDGFFCNTETSSNFVCVCTLVLPFAALEAECTEVCLL